jgi:hypothetical protein
VVMGGTGAGTSGTSDATAKAQPKPKARSAQTLHWERETPPAACSTVSFREPPVRPLRLAGVGAV